MCVYKGQRNRLVSTIDRLVGFCLHCGNLFFLCISVGDGTVGLWMGLDGGSRIWPASTTDRLAVPCPHNGNRIFLSVRLGTGRRDFPRVCRKITYSACPDNYLTGGPIPAQRKSLISNGFDCGRIDDRSAGGITSPQWGVFFCSSFVRQGTERCDHPLVFKNITCSVRPGN